MSPVENGAGYGRWTAMKQTRLRDAAGHLIGAASLAVAKNAAWAHPRLLVIDLTAGPGVLNGCDGSPLIFADLVKGLTSTSVDLVLCERNRRNSKALRERARVLDGRRIRTHVLDGDHATTVPSFFNIVEPREARQRFGLVYFDPNGCDSPPLEVYRDLQADRRTQRLDLLLNIGATGYKRSGRNGELAEVLHAIPKKLKFISQERVGQAGDPFGWTFVIATDWEGSKPKHGFVKLDSREGRRALWYATHCYTKEPLPRELEDPQLRLVA